MPYRTCLNCETSCRYKNDPYAQPCRDWTGDDPDMEEALDMTLGYMLEMDAEDRLVFIDKLMEGYCCKCGEARNNGEPCHCEVRRSH